MQTKTRISYQLPSIPPSPVRGIANHRFRRSCKLRKVGCSVALPGRGGASDSFETHGFGEPLDSTDHSRSNPNLIRMAPPDGFCWSFRCHHSGAHSILHDGRKPLLIQSETSNPDRITRSEVGLLWNKEKRRAHGRQASRRARSAGIPKALETEKSHPVKVFAGS